jgi:hypothetical protein
VSEQNERRQTEFQRRELDRVQIGMTGGKSQQPIEAILEISQVRRDDGSLGRPRLYVVLAVDSRSVRLEAEGRGESPSPAERAGEALLGLAEDQGHLDAFRQALRDWQEENPRPDGSTSRGLRTTGKTERKRARKREDQ